MSAILQTARPTEATTNLGEKLHEGGIVQKPKGYRYSDQVKKNFITEVEKGFSVHSVCKRFSVSLPTGYQWMQKHRGNPRVRRTELAVATPREPRPDYSTAAQHVFGPPPAVDGTRDGDVLLSRAEATLLASLVREAVGRIKDGNLRGQMAILALRLMG